MIKVELTKSQVQNLKDFIECTFINFVRDVDEIDNMDYLLDMCDIYKKLKRASNDKG
jgi:hypothetical protein